MEKYTNDLIHESSPYLLQHAHNPVNWVAWSPDVFDRAQRENKLVLISVGYSACHWCHVMEKESFEDEEVAVVMNKHFINVKVDREERPDVDQVYMTAVQLMTQQGGWPLNCFTTPDGRPIHGGTYFPKDQWMHILRSLNHVFTNDPSKVEEFAASVHEGVIASELIKTPAHVEAFSKSHLDELFLRWSKSFDRAEGGNSRAPKFPLPSNQEFLLDTALRSGDASLLKHVELTLDKMAMGGIYDQIGGGFSRYAVDMLWKVPHFEKMLYDNGQLLSVYAKAYRHFKKPLYRRVMEQTIAWLRREMSDESGAFYSALDADSEGEEGKFYVWEKQSFLETTGSMQQWASEFYSLNQRGHWEEGKYILLRTQSDKTVCTQQGCTPEELENNIERLNARLLEERDRRVRPGLDDKCLTSWNAMAIKGLCDAHEVLNDETFKAMALRTARWIQREQVTEEGKIYRSYKNGKSSVDGFLEDYAHVIAAWIALYRITLDEQWLSEAKSMMELACANFQDAESRMFYFTPSDTQLIARKMEINDNVIPSSNAMMALNLHTLGIYFRNDVWSSDARQMLANVYDGMEMYGSGYSHWGLLLNRYVFPFREVAVAGEEVKSFCAEIMVEVASDFILAGTHQKSTIPFLSDKSAGETTRVYVCKHGACELPVDSAKEAIEQLSNIGHG